MLRQARGNGAGGLRWASRNTVYNLDDEVNGRKDVSRWRPSRVSLDGYHIAATGAPLNRRTPASDSLTKRRNPGVRAHHKPEVHPAGRMAWDRTGEEKLADAIGLKREDILAPRRRPHRAIP